MGLQHRRCSRQNHLSLKVCGSEYRIRCFALTAKFRTRTAKRHTFGSEYASGIIPGCHKPTYPLWWIDCIKRFGWRCVTQVDTPISLSCSTLADEHEDVPTASNMNSRIQGGAVNASALQMHPAYPSGALNLSPGNTHGNTTTLQGLSPSISNTPMVIANAVNAFAQGTPQSTISPPFSNSSNGAFLIVPVFSAPK